MRRFSPRRTTCALCVLSALALGGCITVLPKAKPVQLYRFGPPATGGAPSAVSPGGAARDVVLAEVRLPPGAAGDGVLTLTGDQAAYIGGARWLEPASLLFQADVEAAFAARARGVLLLDRGQASAAAAVLRVDVTRFETRYAEGSGAPPTVVVRLRATLDRPGGGGVLAREFDAEQPAGADRVSDLVSAYDAAVAHVLADLVAWTDAAAPGPAPDPTPQAAPGRPS
jgi:cholesterol transport system auxiliary component